MLVVILVVYVIAKPCGRYIPVDQQIYIAAAMRLFFRITIKVYCCLVLHGQKHRKLEESCGVYHIAGLMVVYHQVASSL